MSSPQRYRGLEPRSNAKELSRLAVSRRWLSAATKCPARPRARILAHCSQSGGDARTLARATGSGYCFDISMTYEYVLTYACSNHRPSACRPSRSRQAQGGRGRSNPYRSHRGWPSDSRGRAAQSGKGQALPSSGQQSYWRPDARHRPYSLLGDSGDGRYRICAAHEAL